ncbi:Cof-type HAD-IIB family hydrolase [Mycoplasmopsis hyopharyngis]|uniref:Cof-type HAD-IIB family hydrolase n=1 Tax=Mycoplasmopsis hyopharyngis TaxID=29558 RepID=UPI00387316F2
MNTTNKKTFKRIIFSDVDGTIYPFPGKVLHPKTKDYLQHLKEKHDAEFILNTGNGPFEKIKRLARAINCRYLVTGGGSSAYDVLENKYLNVVYMDKKEAQKVFDVAKELNGRMYLFGVDQYYLNNANKEMKDFLSSFCEYYDWDESGKMPEDLNKIEFYGTEEEIKNIYQKLISSNINLKIINLNSHIEITPIGVDKGSGIKWYCEKFFNADVQKVMAIGDSQNDIPMFQTAGFSYAMANADEETRPNAKYHTSAVDQLGLIEAIEDYIYRTKFDYEMQQKQDQMEKRKAKRG